MKEIEDYSEVVGDEVIGNIYKKASKMYGTHVLNINSTYQGGGVAEMLSSFVPMLNHIGIQVGWRILHGNPDFFSITKKFHNALQGDEVNLTDIKKEIYEETNEVFSHFTHIDHDLVMIHDPQPLPLIKYYDKRQPWIFRIHVDLSDPNKELWDYLKRFLIKYDRIIYSHENYVHSDLPVDHKIITPAIDPLSPKNKKLDESTMEEYLEKGGIPQDKPFIAQVSRFDKWKDPEGVIDIYKQVKENVDCRLVMCGSMASDDPEGNEVFNRVVDKAEEEITDFDDNVIFITSQNNILVNSIQQTADVVIQKSLREGFGLTVSEALWKKTPVVASNVGGITIQIDDGSNGYLVDPNDTAAFSRKIIELMRDQSKRRHMGERGKEKVRNNFLITALIQNYLDLISNQINNN